MMQRYQAYKDSGFDWLGEVPEHWETTKAKWLFANISEKNYPDEQLLSATQEFGVVPRDMLEDRVVMPMGELVHFKLAQRGDFVISLRSFQGGIEYSEYRGLVSPAYTVLRNKKPIDKTYFKYLMKCFLFISELQTSITGIREGKNINYKDFAEITIPVPPISEQTKIAKYIEEQTAVINQFLANKRQLITLLEEQKQVVINTAVTQGLETAVARKPSGIDWLGDIPAHWIVAPVYARFSVQLGKMLDTKRITGKYLQPYLRNTDVQWDEINVANLPQMDFSETDKQRFSLKPGDLLVCEGGEVGRAAIWQNQLPECYYQKALHRLRPLSECDESRFMFYLLKSAVSCDVFVGGTEKATIYHLTAEKLKRHRFPFPPKVEQKEIVSHIEQKTSVINTAIRRIQREIELIEEYRTTLIAHAVTGKIDVRPQPEIA